VRLTERVEKTVVETLAEVALGELFDHEVGMAYQVVPQQGLTPCVTILVVGRAVALDERIAATPIVLPTPYPDEELVAARVRQAVEAIRAERARQAQLPQGVPLLGVPR
jgi:hypothetical protein